MVDEKKERFIKVASRRVQYVLDDLDKLSNCSNRSNYDYSKKDVEKMFTAIKNKLKVVEETYRTKIEKQKTNFTFE